MSKYEFLRTLFPVKVSCEDPSVEYICLPGRRLIYRDGKYVGWYNPRLRKAVGQVIKDSGERREFSTGAVRDISEGKGRCDLMPLDVVGEFLEDKIIGSIARFQKTLAVEFLYGALREFSTFYEKGSFEMLLEVSKHFEEGCKKYGEGNWQKGLPISCYIDSMVRHYLKFLRGDEDEEHGRAFVWNVLCCAWTTNCLQKDPKEV